MVAFCCLDADENVIQFGGWRLWGARDRTLPQFMIAGRSRFLRAACGRGTATAAAARVRRLPIEYQIIQEAVLRVHRRFLQFKTIKRR